MTQARSLHRYWIKFAPPEPTGFKLGCGVSATSEVEARDLALRHAGGSFPLIVSVEADIDVSSLDAKHVIPNMGDCTRPGVWFPNLG